MRNLRIIDKSITQIVQCWWLYYVLLFGLYLGGSVILPAQNKVTTTVEERQFDQKSWQRIIRDIDYSDEKPPVPSKGGNGSTEFEIDLEDLQGLGDGTNAEGRKHRKGGGRQRTPSERYESESDVELPNVEIEPSALFTQIVRILGIVLIVLALGALIYWIIRENLFQRNTKVAPVRNVQLLKRLEDNLPESELEKLLREVLEKGDYQLAIRIHYLIVIRRLSEIKWIKWRKNKTNAHYASELRAREGYTTFKELTLIFEQVWYGDKILEHTDYQKLAPSFSAFIHTLKSDNR